MISLDADNYYIEIDNNNPNWCKCWLVTLNKEKTYLGAESQEYIVRKLTNVLCNSAYEVNSQALGFTWLLTLSETHITFYYSTGQGYLEILIQNSNGKNIFSLKIDKKNKKKNCHQLRDS